MDEIKHKSWCHVPWSVITPLWPVMGVSRKSGAPFNSQNSTARSIRTPTNRTATLLRERCTIPQYEYDDGDYVGIGLQECRTPHMDQEAL